uniref:Uncharacterized protein n=1 Tax=Anopheles christyi TaxID=43041 RepID=A0A182JQ11_9DIPT
MIIRDEMEQWVSDTFFSYFPSFNKKQKEKKTDLSRTRQQEYQEYLKNIPEVTTKHQQYMQNRLEQQLKTMQLEEQLEHERLRSEKIRIANEQNHIRRLQLLANLENDHKVFNPYDGQRKAFSENGVKATGADPVAGTAEANPNAPHPKGGSFSSGDERTKAYRYFGNSVPQQDKPQSHPPFVSVGPAASSAPLSSEQDYESSSETTGNSPAMVTGDHRYQHCKSCRTDVDRSFLLPQPSIGKHKRRPHCAKCGGGKRLEAYSSKREDNTQRCIKCDRNMKRINGTKASLCAVCTLAAEAEQKSLFHPKKLHIERRHRSMLETDDDDVQVHRAPVSPSHNPFKVIDIQYHESDNDNGDLDVLNPVIVRNNYRKPPFSLNIDKDSLFHPSKKTPEPVLSVNIRHGEVFVDNKLRMGGAAGTSRHAPVSPSDVDDGLRDGETSSATVGDDMLDERIAKYVRHYNTLWMKRGNGRKNNGQHNDYHHQHHHHHHQPSHHSHYRREQQEEEHNDRMKGNKSGSLLPSLSPPKVYVSDRPENLKSDALKLMEKKWEVPAVERTKINEKGSTRVLTQLGAIRKQLQLEQLQMDGPSGYSKNY